MKNELAKKESRKKKVLLSIELISALAFGQRNALIRWLAFDFGTYFTFTLRSLLRRMNAWNWEKNLLILKAVFVSTIMVVKIIFLSKQKLKPIS